MADVRGTMRRIPDLDAEAARLARAQSAGAGISEGAVLPVRAGNRVRQYRVTSVELLGNNAVRLTCVPAANHD